MTRLVWLPAVGAFLLLLAIGCGPKTPIQFFDKPIPLLLFMGEQTRMSGTPYPAMPKEPRFGSISGLAPDEATQQWIGVIDDRERTRVVWLKVAYDKTLSVEPTRMKELRAAPGVNSRAVMEADLEAIVALPKGGFMLSEEGHVVDDTNDVFQPALLQMSPDGVVTSVINFPKEFQIADNSKTGLRENQGFEALGVTPKGRLIAGLEQPLLPEPVTSFDRPGSGRLVEFVPSGSTYKPGKQWRYMISPTPRVEGFDDTCTDGENGLVELLAISETTLISMERSCQMTRDRQFTANTVLLFSVELTGSEAIKRPLLDFKDLQPRLSSLLPRLENFEALTFGPIVNGVKTLLLASDDNFRATQKTSFLLFGMK